MTIVHALQFAGIILLCIVSAHFFAPRKMRWSDNLRLVEPVFRQVFIIHCVFLIGCVLAMALVCLLLPQQLIGEPLGRLVLGFMALFWVARVGVQFFYYESSIKKQFPVFNLLFSAAFVYLATLFTVLSLISY